MTKTLTGRKRYRLLTRMFRTPLLVLQVEEDWHGYDIIFDRQYHNLKVWRDARVEDQTVVHPFMGTKRD